MHPVNRVLYQVGLVLQKTRDTVFIPRAFQAEYWKRLSALRKNPRGFAIYSEELYETGSHPYSFQDFECGFASLHITRTRPARMLDVGSYRHFILGLLAHYPVTTIDVRPRSPINSNEEVITGDAKRLPVATGSFDVVVSLCAIEHFGLGRYGDDFDLDADRAAMAEMTRCLKPGGRLIFSTTITRGAPQIVFNAHRIYTLELIRGMCSGLEAEDERFYSRAAGGYCDPGSISDQPEVWDVYLGCWRKPA